MYSPESSQTHTEHNQCSSLDRELLTNTKFQQLVTVTSHTLSHVSLVMTSVTVGNKPRPGEERSIKMTASQHAVAVLSLISVAAAEFFIGKIAEETVFIQPPDYFEEEPLFRFVA